MTLVMRSIPSVRARNPVYRSIALAQVRAACRDLQILALASPDLAPQRQLIVDARSALQIARALGCQELDAAIEALGAMAADGCRWRAAHAAMVDAALAAAVLRVCRATPADFDRAAPLVFPAKASTA